MLLAAAANQRSGPLIPGLNITTTTYACTTTIAASHLQRSNAIVSAGTEQATLKLLSLPPELIQAISDELDVRDIKNVRLVCRRLGVTLGPVIFRSLVICVSKNTLESDLAKLRTLAAPGCPAVYATREITIGALSPCHDPTYTGPTWKYVDNEWVAEDTTQNHAQLAKVRQDVQALIVPAISSLKGLQSVSWKPMEKDDCATQALVMDAISGRALNLRSLHITLSHCKIPISFDAFSGLRSISIFGTSQKHHESTFDSLSRMVARSPGLTTIDITSNWRYCAGINGTQSLHQLFKYCTPETTPPLRLTHLGLQMCLVKLDAKTVRHLRQLKSLRLTHIEDPYARQQYTMEAGEFGESALRREQKHYGSSLEEFWVAWRETGVRLEDITVDVVVPSFLDYLASYSGVKRLHLTPGGFKEGSASDLAAEDFFSRALPRHTGTVEALNVDAVYEGGWSFGSHNHQVLVRCRKLTRWRMNVIETPESNNTAKLLNIAITSMPQLESIGITATTSEELRGAYCGSPIMSHLMRTTRAIARNVEQYTAPSAVDTVPTRLHEVTVSSHKVFTWQGSRYEDRSPVKDTSEDECSRYHSYVAFC